VLSLEMFRNEVHIFLALLFKAHFCSFVEHTLGWRKMATIYAVAGVSGTLA
jgi:membrane associated rhomboid family serine protease